MQQAGFLQKGHFTAETQKTQSAINGKRCDPGVSAVRFCSEVTKAKLSRRRAASLFLHIPRCRRPLRQQDNSPVFTVGTVRTAPLQTPGHLQDNGGVADVLPESAVHMLRLLDLHHGAGNENECDICVHIVTTYPLCGRCGKLRP